MLKAVQAWWKRVFGSPDLTDRQRLVAIGLQCQVDGCHSARGFGEQRCDEHLRQARRPVIGRIRKDETTPGQTTMIPVVALPYVPPAPDPIPLFVYAPPYEFLPVPEMDAVHQAPIDISPSFDSTPAADPYSGTGGMFDGGGGFDGGSSSGGGSDGGW